MEQTQHEYNSWLAEQGKNLEGLPLFRLVLSHEQLEWRRGEFNEFAGDILLRRTAGTKLVPKYPYIPEGRWILEKWFPPSLAFNPNLPMSDKGSYEPIFVFQDKNWQELPVAKLPLEFIVARVMNRTIKQSRQQAIEDRAAQEIIEAAELQKFSDSIDVSEIASLLHTKEAIVRP